MPHISLLIMNDNIMSLDAEATAWARACARCLHAADIAALRQLLATPPSDTAAADLAFYQGHAAAASTDYQAASRAFQQALQAALVSGDQLSAYASQIWLAYTQSVLGNYALAEALLAHGGHDPPADLQLQSARCFAQGILASYRGALPDAQAYLEQARTLAQQSGSRWLDLRASVNLASVYQHQGMLDRALCLSRRLTPSEIAPTLGAGCTTQIRNLVVNCWRLQGDLDMALAVALPLPEGTCAGPFAGWLALSTALVAVDADRFALAESYWVMADHLLAAQANDELVVAELAWSLAWLRYRQGLLEAAQVHAAAALCLIDDLMDMDYLHGRAVAGVIALARGDLGSAECHLHAAYQGFRRYGHRVGMLSTQLHLTSYYWQTGQAQAAQLALGEALASLRTCGMFGAYYWCPETMVRLCTLAMTGEAWEQQAQAVGQQSSARLGREGLEGTDNLAEVWGDFAATLAARRLARTHWRAFVPLLDDQRARVRQRATIILLASEHTAAIELVEASRAAQPASPAAPAPVPALPHPIAVPSPALPAPPTAAPTPGLPVVVQSFGCYRVLQGDRLLKLQRTGTRKALAVLGILLLAGERGVESRDLALLLWPGPSEAQQRASLYSAISALRAVLGDSDGTLICPTAGRYYLRVDPTRLRWDWWELRAAVAQIGCGEGAWQRLSQCYHPALMEGFFDLLPEPQSLSRPLHMQWMEIYERIHDLVEERAAEAASWIERECNSPNALYIAGAPRASVSAYASL
jgi:tetratricopeptide (TPR) repeat protein